MNHHQRLAPLPPQEWADELAEIRQALGTPLNIHNIMAHHSSLTQARMNFRYHIVRDSTLTARQRELFYVLLSIVRSSMNRCIMLFVDVKLAYQIRRL